MVPENVMAVSLEAGELLRGHVGELVDALGPGQPLRIMRVDLGQVGLERRARGQRAAAAVELGEEVLVRVPAREQRRSSTARRELRRYELEGERS